MAVYNHWTGLDWTGLDWSTGLEWSTGLFLELKVQHYISILGLTGVIA